MLSIFAKSMSMLVMHSVVMSRMLPLLIHLPNGLLVLPLQFSIDPRTTVLLRFLNDLSISQLSRPPLLLPPRYIKLTKCTLVFLSNSCSGS